MGLNKYFIRRNSCIMRRMNEPVEADSQARSESSRIGKSKNDTIIITYLISFVASNTTSLVKRLTVPSSSPSPQTPHAHPAKFL